MSAGCPAGLGEADEADADGGHCDCGIGGEVLSGRVGEMWC